MMRIFVRVPVVAAGLLTAAMSVAPAHAQSFFQTLFGQSSPRPAQVLPPPTPSYRAPVNVSRSNPSQDQDDEDASRVRHLGGAKVRTVCVRMCDGYYFPISSHTKQSRLTPDSLRCKAACGHEARLFYSTDGGDDPASMVDLTGRRYDAIQNAFAYRKKLTPGCACKPVPWSAEERMRHTRYAIERQEALAKAREEEAARLAAADGRAAGQSAPKGEDGQAKRAATVTAEGDSKSAAGQEVSEVRPTSAAPVPAEQPLADSEAADQAIQRRERQLKSERPARRTLARTAPQSQPHTASAKPARQAAAAAPASGGMFNFGKSKYVWPGDPR